MDIIRNYAEFKEDIVKGFKDLINVFNLKITNPFEGCYLLIGKKCNIKFTYDRGDVFCCFLRLGESPYDQGYNVSLVYKYLYSNRDIIEDNARLYDPKLQILSYSSLIGNYLENILNGDFTWLSGFIEKYNRENKLSQYILENLEVDNSISQKFWNGDETWKDDIEKYLNDNNIDL